MVALGLEGRVAGAPDNEEAMWIIQNEHEDRHITPTKSWWTTWYSGGEWSARPYLATRYETFEEAQRVAVALQLQARGRDDIRVIECS